ncbi:MAG: PhzA/PhzB family protein [Verrucomicrobia bacterium]|nr:PhzA/PhzB family protein [Verrucomicrobiota bacterium]
MSKALELITKYFDCLKTFDASVDRCADLFADNGTFDFPYLSSVGMPTCFEGKAAVREVLNIIRAHFSSFTVSKIEIYELKDGHGLVVEYRTDTTDKGTGRNYVQNYITLLLEENGKIKLLREYLNVISTARALLPRGLADVPEAPSA